MGQILTSISGLPISAASAGYSPTNSADVSAIASGYQVVSSTSTQLYAGTAYLTEVNDAPVSASRAGNAANAGMANSAYYDGTGRLISSLPDSAAVSSIASSYAESAASGKLDSSASSSFYSVDNPSGFITGVDLSDYATTAYVDSAVSGKQDSSAMSAYALSSDVSGVIDTVSGYSGNWFNTNITVAFNSAKWNSAYDTVSANSASWGGGATGDYVEKSAMEVAIGSGNTVSSTAFAQGADNVVSGASVAFGVNNTATQSAISVGGHCSANYNALAVGQHCGAWENALAVGNTAIANNQGLAVGDRCTASVRALAVGYQASAYRDSVAAGEFCSAKNTAVAFGKYNLHVDGSTSTGDSAAFVIGDGEYGAHHDLMLVTKDGEITMYSSTADTAGTGIMSSIRAISAAATGGGVDSATVSSIASSYAESAASGKLDESASSSFYTTANESGFLTGLPVDISVRDLSASRHVRATATGQDLYGNFDYAGMYFRSGSQRPYNIGIDNTGTNFYIATARNGFERIYASSIQSWNGKLDSSASSSFYTTANESGFVDSAYVDSAVSGKADSSALSSYVPYSSLEYNTSSAISGINGSALAAGSTYSAGEGIDITDDVISVEAPVDIVAGPGIVIDNPDGNTLRVSQAANYETVLCNTLSNSSCTLSEAYSNFERIRISFTNEDPTTIAESYSFTPMTVEFYCSDIENNAGHKVTLSWCGVDGTSGAGSNNLLFRIAVWQFTTSTTFAKLLGKQFYVSWTGTDTSKLYVTRVVGIHRIAGGN